MATLRALALARGLQIGEPYSPHLHRFNERIQLREPANDAQIVAAFERIDIAGH